MAQAEHHGVGALVTNADRTRFFVQQKDATYPQFPRAYSVFGGAREAGESLEQAVARELLEELGPNAQPLLHADRVHVLTTRVDPGEVGDAFDYSLFEVVVDDAQLDALAEVPVLEGERGAVVTRAELAELPFVWGLEVAVRAYLDAR